MLRETGARVNVKGTEGVDRVKEGLGAGMLARWQAEFYGGVLLGLMCGPI